MGRRQKKKLKTKKKQQVESKPVSTEELISKKQMTSENIIRLKLTTRKGTRIESVPLKKLEKIANKEEKYWKIEKEWLLLFGI